MEDLIPIIIVIVAAVAKLAGAVGSRKQQNQPPPAPPSDFDAEMLEEMIFGDTDERRVVITRDDGVPTKVRPASVPEAPVYDPSADDQILEDQRRYAMLAEQAAAANAQTAAAAPSVPAPAPEAPAAEEAVSAADLAEFIRQDPRSAVIISEILAPPKSLRS